MTHGERITVVHRIHGEAQLAAAFGVLAVPGEPRAFVKQTVINAVTTDLLYTGEGVFTIDLEGITWCRGWDGPAVNALRAVAALEA